LLRRFENTLSGILEVRQTYNDRVDNQIIRGVSSNMFDVRVLGVYIYLEFNANNHERTIYANVTHLGNNQFRDENGQWVSIDTSILRETTQFRSRIDSLSHREQQQNAKLQTVSNKFDCTKMENGGDVLGKTMCPGLYSDYLIEFPRSDVLPCNSVSQLSGTNCKDFSLEGLKAVHFHAKIMYRTKSDS